MSPFSTSSVFPLSSLDSYDNRAQPLLRPHPQLFHNTRRMGTVWREAYDTQKSHGECHQNMRESQCQHTANRESKNLVQKIAFHRNGIHFQDLSRQDQVFLLA